MKGLAINRNKLNNSLLKEENKQFMNVLSLCKNIAQLSPPHSSLSVEKHLHSINLKKKIKTESCCSHISERFILPMIEENKKDLKIIGDFVPTPKREIARSKGDRYSLGIKRIHTNLKNIDGISFKSKKKKSSKKDGYLSKLDAWDVKQTKSQHFKDFFF